MNVFNDLACKNMGDYHNLYLMSDVILLADVFEMAGVCRNLLQLTNLTG